MRADHYERFFRSACVLVIDDDDGVRAALKRLLETSGYRTLVAASGAEGLAMLQSQPGEVALCICDFKMPGLDGIETLTRMHELDSQILRVLLTGYATLDAAIEATNRGLDAFITKPYQSRELRSKIETLLSAKAHRVARERLGGIPLFRGVPDDVLARIHPTLQAERVSRGQVVQELGAASERLCIVVVGELQIEARTPEGRLRPVAHLGPGEHFGDGSLAQGEPSLLRTVASVDTELLVLRRDEFQRLKEQYPQIAQAVASALTRQLHKVISGVESPSLILACDPSDALPGAALALAKALAAEGADAGFLELNSPGDPGAEPGPHPELRAGSEGELRRYRLAKETSPSPQLIIRALGALRQHHRLVVVELPGAGELRDAARGQAQRSVEWIPAPSGRVDVSVATLEPGDPSPPLRARIARTPGERTQADTRRLARRILGSSFALALGAGGARGIAHFGALREFARAGLELDAVSGASIGAAVGACLAIGLSLDDGEQAVRLLFDEIAAGSPAFGVPVWQRVWDRIHHIGAGKTFEDALVPFLCNATDLVIGDEVVFDAGPIAPAVCASCATPGIFPPFRHQGRILADAALVNGLPSDCLVARGYGLVAAIDVFSDARWRSPPGPPSGWRRLLEQGLPALSHKLTAMRVVVRAVMLSARHLVVARAQGCDLTIRPEMDGSMSSFTSTNLPQLLESGRRAAEPAARDLLLRRAAMMERWRKRV